MPTPGEITYDHDAFISYSRRDIDFARLLEKTLESYSPPKASGLRQQRLDVFRDEGDFTGSDYEKAIERHLTNSRKLLVLCSPSARASKYVDDEIRRFARLRGAENIIPVLLSGIPNNEATPDLQQEMSFPTALCEAMAMPLAVEYRQFKGRREKIDSGLFEGSWFAILAGLYDVSRSLIEERERKRQARNRRILTGIVSSVFIVLSTLTIWAMVERTTATNRANLALARQLATESSRLQRQQSWDSLVQGVLLAVESVRYTRTAEGIAALQNGLSLLPGPSKVLMEAIDDVVTVDSTGRTFVIARNDRVVVRRLPEGEDIALLTKAACATCMQTGAVAISKDGLHLAYVQEGRAQLLRREGQSYVKAGAECAVADHPQTVNAIALSADARYLAVLTRQGYVNESGVGVFVWTSTGDGCIELDFPTASYPTGVAFSTEGTILAIAGQDQRSKRVDFAGLWQLPSFSSDGELSGRSLHALTEAIADHNVGQVAATDVSSGESSRAQRLAAAGDGLIIVWERAGEQLQEIARIPPNETTLLGFADAGLTLLTFDRKVKQLRAWPLAAPLTWEGDTPGSESNPKIAFVTGTAKLISATSRNLEQASRFDTQALLSAWPEQAAERGAPPTRRITDLKTLLPNTAFKEYNQVLSPDGKFLLLDIDDNKRIVVNIETKESTPISIPNSASDVALAPGGRLVAYNVVGNTKEGDSLVLVGAGEAVPRTQKQPAKILALTFSTDGMQLIVAIGSETASTIRRLRLADLKETARFNTGGEISAVATNSDGTLIAVGSSAVFNRKSTVRVWHMPNPSRFGFLSPPAAPTLKQEVQAVESIASIALSGNGTTMAVASAPLAHLRDRDRFILQQWTFSARLLIRDACLRIGRDLTADEWAVYLPGEPYRPTCSKVE